MTERIKKHIIFTNKARCRDCYRCVRACTVKAIKMFEAQASIDTDRCILCGTCIKECPQQAKQYRKDVEIVKEFFKAGETVLLSLAPSFPAFFEESTVNRVPSALRSLGFSYISETAIGAYLVSKEAEKIVKKYKNKSHIVSFCPVVVNLVEKYYPQLSDLLLPVSSPMIAHAKYLKEKHGYDKKVVFIGPCIAKKDESEKEIYLGYVDAVLTFDELKEWFEEEAVDLKKFEESWFDEPCDSNAKLFALSGGFSKTANMNVDLLSSDSITVTGFESVKEALNFITPGKNILIDPLFCSMGCINGAGIKNESNYFERKERVLQYVDKSSINSKQIEETKIDLSSKFEKYHLQKNSDFSEEQIKEVLEKTGKIDDNDQLNCGACGYNTCREKAVAVLEGIAEIEMCIPYMRRIAEQRSDKIIESSPNGIVILDRELNILNMNPAFKRFFYCNNSVYGKKISILMDPALFEDLIAGDDDIIERTVNHEKYNLMCHQKLYKLKNEKQYVGIFVDITKNLADKEQLSSLRNETVAQAQELLTHQIEMAQKLAKILGENTAKGELLVENLLRLAKDEQSKNKKDNNWLWDIYTSK
ncbi:MAG: [Fe-Fe] hydrogenase large subunit C-terminal domain-containing protein [bacterium]